MTDWVDRINERLALMPYLAQVLAVIVTPEEKARLRRLAAEWRERDEDPPADLVSSCLDGPLFDPGRDSCPRGPSARRQLGARGAVNGACGIPSHD